VNEKYPSRERNFADVWAHLLDFQTLANAGTNVHSVNPPLGTLKFEINSACSIKKLDKYTEKA